MRLKCSLYSRPLKKRRPNPNTCKQLWLKTELYLTVYVKFVCFFFCLFVCMVLIFWTVKILKIVIVLFSKCWPPTVVSHALFLCYSLLNMFVTVAVINVKLLAVWGYVAFLHVSTLRTVSHTLYGHEYEWDWDQVSGLNHHRCCACVCVRIMCVCACYCLS